MHFVFLKTRKRIALKFANFEAISRINGIDFFSKNIEIYNVLSNNNFKTNPKLFP
jgi:hypothetical protein